MAETDDVAMFPALIYKGCSSVMQIPDDHNINDVDDICEVPPPILLEEDEM
jgi:hypothetical protein